MRDPAWGRVQCELSGRGRELEEHDQYFNELTGPDVKGAALAWFVVEALTS